MKVAFAALLVILPTLTFATWQGTVVGVSDGDTITVLTNGKKQVKVRLVEIDAPEKKQAFGQQSKKSLSNICYKKTVNVDEKGKDKYKRTLGRITCDGVDANSEQVKRGMAWAFLKYLTDQNIADLEKEARANNVGLWSETNPVPPWVYRHPEKAVKNIAALANIPSNETFSCAGKNAYCKSMKTCAEARYYLEKCGATKLDRDGDGIPCENVCGH